MNRSINIITNLFVVSNLCLGVLIVFGLNLVSGLDVWVEAGANFNGETSPDTYDPSHVFYLCSPNIDYTKPYLRGTPIISDASDPDLNKHDIKNGEKVPFSYPAWGKSPIKLKRTTDIRPFISLTLNSKAIPDRTVIATIGIDTNGDYDNSDPDPTTLEHRCEFPSYQTAEDFSDGTMEEENYEAYGTWQGGLPPAVITSGRIVLIVTQTTPNGQSLLLYCGFNYKLSWCALPFMHYDLIPRANIVESSCHQGIPPNEPIKEGTRTFFDGSDSYDLNDDLNGNEKIDNGEVDRLKYKWLWGDGTETDFEYNNKKASHVYTMDKTTLNFEYTYFEVNLTIKDPEGHIAWDITYIRIFRGNNSPKITSIKINDIEQYPEPGQDAEIRSVLSHKVKVWFSAAATDEDNDDLVYNWDFNSDGEFEISGTEAEAAVVSFKFYRPRFTAGIQQITLVVSDETLSDNATEHCNITLTINEYPVAKLRAKREFDDEIYFGKITINLDEKITFYADESYDPDNMPGFDPDDDNVTNFQLKYRWNFDSNDPSMITEWLADSFYEYAYEYTSSYKFYVILYVDDGLNVSTSEPFEINLNVRPVAKIIIDPASYDRKGDLQVGRPIHLNASGSYDPNGDKILNYTWKLGTGESEINKFGQNVQHIFTTWGEHFISLEVSDGVFWSSEAQIKIDVPQPKQIKGKLPSFNVHPLDVFTDEDVYFNLTLSNNNDINLADFKLTWYFGDGNFTVFKEISTIYKYSKPGHYKISLEITDETDLVAKITNVIVTVKNKSPNAKIHPVKPVKAEEATRLSGSESFDIDGTVVRYIWAFGDGSAEVRTSEPHVNHTWRQPGRYYVTLTVQDDLGSADETQIYVEVKENYAPDDQIDYRIVLSAILVILFILTIILQLIRRNINKKRRGSSTP